jgi:excisionase family DNA binding protein
MEKLLTIRETAARCGVSGRQIYKLAASGRFGPEFVRIARSVRVRESELDAWLAAGCPARAQFQAQRAAGARP